MMPLLYELPPDAPATTDPGVRLAVDEACLEAAERGDSGEVIRLWEFAQPVVVIGRGGKLDVEVDREFCASREIPIQRRCSGGAAIVAGPGCLMYSLVLSMRQRSTLRNLDFAHRFVMDALVKQLSKHLSNISFQGTCDLTWQDRKFSGNSARVSRDHLLYHGTLLYGADLDLVASCLKTPPRQPDYRRGRDHRTFITNLPLDRELLARCVLDAFATEDLRVACPLARAEELACERYNTLDWIQRH